MAEGLLRGVLGGEQDEKAPSTKAVPEAFAAAVAANIANNSPEVAAETVVFLRKQTELLEAQRKTVDAEYEYFEARVATPARPAAADWIPDLYRAVRIGIGIAIAIHDAMSRSERKREKSREHRRSTP
jgi:hypothetical protein